MSPSDSTVLFRAIPTSLKLEKQDQLAIAEFASALSQQVAKHRSFTCLITSNRAVRKLNLQFRGVDYATDVLSFPAGDPDYAGDIAISIESAAGQALHFRHSCLEEVRILMLHGLLHLLGFDHEADRGRMARAEARWRTHFDLSSGLIARARRRRA